MLGADTPSNMSEPAEQTEMEMKAEILSSLKMEIVSLFQTELKSALAVEFGVIKSELQAVKTEIANNTAVLRSDLETIKTTVSDMERGLSAGSGDITSLQDSVNKLKRNVESLQEKCSSPASVSKLFRETLKMDKDVLIDLTGLSNQRDQTANPEP